MALLGTYLASSRKHKVRDAYTVRSPHCTIVRCSRLIWSAFQSASRRLAAVATSPQPQWI